MHTWEVTNSNGQTIRFRAVDICDMPCEFGFEGEETYMIVKVVLVD